MKYNMKLSDCLMTYFINYINSLISINPITHQMRRQTIKPKMVQKIP